MKQVKQGVALRYQAINKHLPHFTSSETKRLELAKVRISLRECASTPSPSNAAIPNLLHILKPAFVHHLAGVFSVWHCDLTEGCFFVVRGGTLIFGSIKTNVKAVWNVYLFRLCCFPHSTLVRHLQVYEVVRAATTEVLSLWLVRRSIQRRRCGADCCSC